MNAPARTDSVKPHPVEIVPGNPACGLILACDHASNHVPADIALGVAEAEFGRHIAYDIGAAGVTRRLAALLGAPAILTNFSRLIIDPNRGRTDPTLVMRLSDGAVVPGNARIDAAGKAARLARFYEPFDAAIDALRADPAGLTVGDNEPYGGGLPGDTIDRHATARGLLNALVEIRQDLIAGEAGQAEWAERFARCLAPLLPARAA